MAKHHVLDLVVAGGRVIDPESGLDAIRTVGVAAGRIVAITEEASPSTARETIDARGLVVAPGFIDLHTHGHDSVNYEFQARDGVTTTLELEIGTYPVAPWYAAREGRTLINFGTTVGHVGARRALLDGDTSSEGAAVLGQQGKFVRSVIDAGRLEELTALLESELHEGALGIGLGINYTPAATRLEIFRVFQLAATQRVPIFVHLRYAGLIDSAGGVEALQEVLANAGATGASLHVAHVTSTGLAETPTMLEMIDGARERGLDVTTEAYPYSASSTYLQSAIFDRGFEERLGITHHDIVWPVTGERLTPETFAKYRQEGGLAVIYNIPEDVIARTYARPHVIIASDGWFATVDGKVVGHPRAAGTFSRVLGQYVRERGMLTLHDALRKMTLLPAQRLEKVAPTMKRKGRVQVGADADLTLFDVGRVRDMATFENPLQHSAGIVHVIVNGTFVVRDEQLVAGARPGKAVRAPNASRASR